jgi:hypothetical protein
MRRRIEMMTKSTTAKNGNERILQTEITSNIWNISIMVSGGIVTNAESLQTKNVS